MSVDPCPRIVYYNFKMGVYDVCTSSTFLLAVACVVLYLMYDYWERLYFKRKGIPGPWPLPIIGTLLSGMKGFTEDLLVKQKKYGKVYGINFQNNIFVIGDIEILQEIMIKKFSVFPNRATQKLNNRPFDKALTMARDEHWKSVRNTLTPAFTGNKMKQMKTIINETCDQLLESFESHRNKDGGIQCKDLFGAYSMDVVAAIFFGLKVDSLKNPNDPFVKHAKGAFNFSITSPKIFAAFFIPGANYIMNFFNISVFDSTLTKFFMDVISHTLELREKGDINRVDVLQLMANAHKLDSDEEDEVDTKTGPKDPKKALTTDEIMSNAMIFLLAGYETTNTALCFISYLLATHPDYQERLTQEVDDLVPTRDDLTYEVLSKMEYLDCFVKEALRMYPPAAITDRDNNEDIVVKDFSIPSGTRIFIPIYAVHHDPDVWEEPEVFNPERFNKENRIRPCSWLPFGDGPRNCIGMRLAMMEIKFAVIRLLQVYKWETCAETEIPPVLNKKSAFISPPNGIKLSVVPRKKTE